MDKGPIDYHVYDSFAKTLLNTIIAVIKFTETQFFNLSFTNLLTRVHWAKIQYYLGLSQEIVTLQLAWSMGRTCALVSTTVKYGRIRSTSNKSASGRICERSSTR